jgi:hypothetical protein
MNNMSFSLIGGILFGLAVLLSLLVFLAVRKLVRHAELLQAHRLNLNAMRAILILVATGALLMVMGIFL